jgi:hypothetical protein
MKPELIAPGVFVNNELRHLVVTYDGSVLLLYVDGVRHSHSLELHPGATLFSDWALPLNSREHYRSGGENYLSYTYVLRAGKVSYYWLAFAPLGIMLALIVLKLNCRPILLILFIGIGVFLPPFLLEETLVLVSGKFVNSENLLLGLTRNGGAALLTLFLLQIIRRIKRIKYV